jgi:SAM-dependent methyltransferase
MLARPASQSHGPAEKPTDAPFRAAHSAFFEGVRAVSAELFRAASEANLQLQRRYIEAVLAGSRECTSKILIDANNEYETAGQIALQAVESKYHAAYYDYLRAMQNAWASLDLDAIDVDLFADIAQSHILIAGFEVPPVGRPDRPAVKTELSRLANHWSTLGQWDPMWVILTIPGFQRIGWEPAAFFYTGILEIDAMRRRLAKLGLSVRAARALDVGCGIGRLTQALCGYFASVDGVDIAPSMILTARKLNRFGSRCRYWLSDDVGLGQFADNTFDLIYSSGTLQHVPSRQIRIYIAEFARVLAPGGLAVFQIPDTTTAAWLPSGEDVISSIASLQAGEVHRLATALNTELLFCDIDNSFSLVRPGFVSCFYVVRK